MRTSKLTLIVLSVAIAIGASSCGRKSIRKQVLAEMSSSDQIETIAPDRARLVFENEFVKAVSVELEPGESLPSHPGKNRLIYALSDCTLELSPASGQAQTHTWQKGEASWLTAGEHAVVNTGNTAARFLVVNRITDGLPGLKEPGSNQNLPDVAPAYATAVFSNDAIQITEVKLPAGAISPAFEGINSLVYGLNLATLKYGQVMGPDSTAKVLYEEAAIRPGDATWRNRGRQILANAGEVDANFLIFSFRE